MNGIATRPPAEASGLAMYMGADGLTDRDGWIDHEGWWHRLTGDGSIVSTREQLLAPAPESGFTFWCSVNGQRASISVERAAVLGLAQFVRSVVSRGRCDSCKAGNHCGQCEGCCD